MTIRIDAPMPCGCQPAWTDSPSGPKAQPCDCDARGDASPLDRALARQKADQAEQAKAGAPKGSYTAGQDGLAMFSGSAREAVPSTRFKSAQEDGSPIDRALARRKLEQEQEARGGAPRGASTE